MGKFRSHERATHQLTSVPNSFCTSRRVFPETTTVRACLIPVVLLAIPLSGVANELDQLVGIQTFRARSHGTNTCIHAGGNCHAGTHDTKQC